MRAGLLQSLLVAACLGATPLLQRIPSAVLWGYFAFMALESLQGSQFWERLLWLLTDPGQRNRCTWHAKLCLTPLTSSSLALYGSNLLRASTRRLLYQPLVSTHAECRLLGNGRAAFMEGVPYRAVAAFTMFQLVALAVVYGVTWIPVGGFLFPLPIIALIPIRTYLLPQVSRRLAWSFVRTA